MKLIKLPDYIYKYISWENSHHQRIVQNNEIFFSSAKKFNDPFDSTIPLRYDLGTDEQILNLFIKLIRNENSTLTEDELKQLARNEMTGDGVRGEPRIQKTIDNQREIIATKYGIFSASYRFDSILMWSHYSNLHKGLCVRFNCEKFKDFIEKECSQKDLIIVWDNTDYKKEYPMLNPFELTDYDLIMKSLLIKSKIWEYEKEIRFILFTHSNKTLILPDGIIDQIILGCKIAKNDKQKIIDICKRKDIQLVQAFQKESAFGLGFVDIKV